MINAQGIEHDPLYMVDDFVKVFLDNFFLIVREYVIILVAFVLSIV